MKPARGPGLLATAIATGLGSGYAPVAPGTFGTAACALLVWLLSPWSSPIADAAAAIAMVALSVASGGAMARARGIEDPQTVVADEFAGYLVSIAFLPKTLPWLGAAFVLFRAFDVVKPWPCRRLEGLPGGWGITMDDVMAGSYVNAILQAARLLVG